MMWACNQALFTLTVDISDVLSVDFVGASFISKVLMYIKFECLILNYNSKTAMLA